MIFRLRDVLVSFSALLTLGGFLFVIIILLALTQKRVFFVQERTGFRMKRFRMIKFSTLRDVEKGVAEEANQKERLTPLGKILRRFSLDELPQLINVLAGDMSLVGPRPLITDYDEIYSESDKLRFKVKPGITGWAQVKGRNSISWKERFQLDEWYVKNRTFMLDIRIVFLTLSVALFGKGVYSDFATTSPRYNGKN